MINLGKASDFLDGLEPLKNLLQGGVLPLRLVVLLGVLVPLEIKKGVPFHDSQGAKSARGPEASATCP